MQSPLQRLRDQLEHGPRISSYIPWDRYDYQSMAAEAKNIMNTSLHEGEQIEARKFYEIATARLQLMLQAEQEIAACDPGDMSLVQLACHLGKIESSLIEDSHESRWHAEAYAWAIVRAMNGRFPSKIKKPSYIVLCSHLVHAFLEGVNEGSHIQMEKQP